MTENQRFKLGYVCGDFGLIDNAQSEGNHWIDLHSMSENSEKNVQICINKMNELAEEKEHFKQSFKEVLKDLEVTTFDKELLEKENEQLKQSQASTLQELLIYRRIANCSNCKYQNYDWFEDGDEFEICEKGNSNQQIAYHICKEWREF